MRIIAALVCFIAFLLTDVYAALAVCAGMFVGIAVLKFVSWLFMRRLVRWFAYQYRCYAMYRDVQDIMKADIDSRPALVTGYIQRWGKKYEQSQEWRSSFRDTMLTNFDNPKNHTHGSSAAHRSTGSRTCANIVQMMGLVPYYYQQSFQDAKLGYDGSRTWLWSKDLHVPSSAKTMHSDHIMIMVDVDYYVDMPKTLSYSDRPILLYTFQPSVPAAQREDYTFTCSNDEFTYIVSGGGKYNHKLWDYNHDSITTSVYDRESGFWLNTAFAVERRQIDEDHYLVALIPVRAWDTPVKCELVSGNSLSRMRVTHGGFNVMRRLELSRYVTSISGIGEHLSIDVDTSVLDGLRHQHKATSIGLTISAVQRELEKATLGEASLLLRYIQEATKTQPMTVYPVSHASLGYSRNLVDHDDDSKPAMVAFMSPLVNGAFNPLMHLGNERWAIDERVTKLANTAGLDIKMDGFITEFINVLIPDRLAQSLHPYTEDVVYQRQMRPQQRAILARAHQQYPNVISSFLKRESYQEIKAPRVISTYNPAMKLAYSRFTYVVTDYVTEHSHWYAFGRPAGEIARQVAEICTHADVILSTDLSRFDGRISPACRAFEVRLMKRLLSPDAFKEFLVLHGKQYNIWGYGKYGTKYDTGTSRGSGSGETAIFNSLMNAMMAYMAIRETHPELPPKHAYGLLGLYGGDDGLTRDVDSEVYVKVCARWGHKLTPEVFVKGAPGVNFLARIYSPNVWFGAPDSMADVARALSKFHVTVALPANVSPLMKLYEKARCYVLTDAETPVLGEYCVAVVRACEANGCRPSDDEMLRSATWNYTTLSDEGKHYPNGGGDHWKVDVLNKQLPGLNLDVFYEALDSLQGKSPQEACNKLLCMPIIVPLEDVPRDSGFVVNGVAYRKTRRGNRGGTGAQKAI